MLCCAVQALASYAAQQDSRLPSQLVISDRPTEPTEEILLVLSLDKKKKKKPHLNVCAWGSHEHRKLSTQEIKQSRRFEADMKKLYEKNLNKYLKIERWTVVAHTILALYQIDSLQKQITLYS